MKNILRYMMLLLTMFALSACGGGGGGGTTQDPPSKSYTLTYASSGNGTLAGTTSQSIVQAGGNATVVTAVPATGYHFVKWTEGASEVGVNATLSVTNVTANHNYTANFAIDTVVKTYATVTINLIGTLPANSTISGATFTITLPANVTPAISNGLVATGVVSNTGTFAGSTLSSQVVYTAATASASATLRVILTASSPAGVTQVGEVATITLQLANNVVPTASNFGVSSVSVIDATLYGTINGMSASVASVALQ